MKATLTKDDPTGWYRCRHVGSSSLTSWHWDGAALRSHTNSTFKVNILGYCDFVRMLDEAAEPIIEEYKSTAGTRNVARAFGWQPGSNLANWLKEKLSPVEVVGRHVPDSPGEWHNKSSCEILRVWDTGNSPGIQLNCHAIDPQHGRGGGVHTIDSKKSQSPVWFKAVPAFVEQQNPPPDPMPVFHDLCQQIHDACDKAGVPSHHPKMARVALPKPMLPQERLELLAEKAGKSRRIEVFQPDMEETRKELEKLRAMKDGCDCLSHDHRGKVFCCPFCNGGYFSSGGDTRHCDDQFNVGCNWSGNDKVCYVKPSEAVSMLREHIADLDCLADETVKDVKADLDREKKRSDRRQRTLQAIAKIVLPQGTETLVQAVERVTRGAASAPLAVVKGGPGVKLKPHVLYAIYDAVSGVGTGWSFPEEILTGTVEGYLYVEQPKNILRQSREPVGITSATAEDICRVLRSTAESGEGDLFGHCPPGAFELKESIEKLRSQVKESEQRTSWKALNEFKEITHRALTEAGVPMLHNHKGGPRVEARIKWLADKVRNTALTDSVDTKIGKAFVKFVAMLGEEQKKKASACIPF